MSVETSTSGNDYRENREKENLIQEFLEITFEWCLKVKVVIKQIEVESRSMEPLSRESVLFECFPIDPIIPVYLVSNYWISYRCEMYSDLMGTTREEIHLEKCVFIRNNSFIAKFCFSDFWVDRIDCGHLFAIIWVSSDK
jgi:hypothetical protein